MFSESSGMPGRRRHRPRTARSIWTPGPRGPVEGVDDGGVDQAVDFITMRPAGPAAACSSIIAVMRLRTVTGDTRIWR